MKVIESKKEIDDNELKEKVYKIRKNNDKYGEELFYSHTDRIKNGFETPIYESIEYLSINDLEKMAESLIDITALRIKVSEEIKTVGGKTNVLTITKDGLKWKR